MGNYSKQAEAFQIIYDAESPGIPSMKAVEEIAAWCNGSIYLCAWEHFLGRWVIGREYKYGGLKELEQFDNIRVVLFDQRVKPAYSGDWIIQYPDGTREVLNDEDFKKYFK